MLLRASLSRASCLLVADEAIDAIPELLEPWTIIVWSCSAMSHIAVVVVATAASVGVYRVTFVGGRTALAELEDAPLVLRDGPSELGAEYPAGSMFL